LNTKEQGTPRGVIIVPRGKRSTAEEQEANLMTA
jgi:hypothetical protein